MKPSFFIYLIFLINLNAKEIYLNATEETVLIFKNKVFASNCSPVALGHIDAMPMFNLLNGYFPLKFVPGSREGTIVCSVRSKESQVTRINFILKKGIKNPMVEISLDKNDNYKNIAAFNNFINGADNFMELVDTREIKTQQFQYKIIKKYQANVNTYLYQILVTPIEKQENIKNIWLDRSKYSPILFSHYKKIDLNQAQGLSLKNPTLLYLMTKKSLKTDNFKKYLR